MNKPQGKYVLFFSNFCNFSKETLLEVTKRNLRTQFVLICVDSIDASQIPPFVDRVPFIKHTTTKDTFIENQIDELLNFLTQEQSQRESQSQQTNFSIMSYNEFNEDVRYESLNIGDSTEQGVSLDMDAFRIFTPNEDDDSKSKRMDSSILESFIANREAEEKSLYERPRMM